MPDSVPQRRGQDTGSAWAPLRIRTFRSLWLAQVGSLIGTWMQTVGAQWLLVEEPGAEALVVDGPGGVDAPGAGAGAAVRGTGGHPRPAAGC